MKALFTKFNNNTVQDNVGTLLPDLGILFPDNIFIHPDDVGLHPDDAAVGFQHVSVTRFLIIDSLLSSFAFLAKSRIGR